MAKERVFMESTDVTAERTGAEIVGLLAKPGALAHISGSSRIEVCEAKRGRLRGGISPSMSTIRVNPLSHRGLEQFAPAELIARLRGKPAVNICSTWLDKTGCTQLMDRSKLRQLFKRHRGELQKLARELDVDLSSLSNWFSRGMTSARIERAVCDRAELLLATEEQDTHAFNQQHQRLLEFAQARP